MKRCKQCKKDRTLDQYTSCKGAADNLQYICRECNKAKAKARRHSITGLFTDIYNGQLYSTKRRGHTLPNYTQESLTSWIKSQPNFISLYDKWVLSGYDRKLKPSCDRLDDYKPYTLDNIRLVTWGENHRKGISDKVTGINTKNCKAIKQFSKKGIFIKEFHSIQQASRDTGAAAGNIQRCCTGEYKSSKGFIWSYV